MKIEHVAIWAKDIDKVCEFYRKYFGGEVQPLYHNPTKQFTSRFVIFESGARLEVMHRPDIEGASKAPEMLAIGKPIATLIASVIKHTSMFCDSRLRRFHVEQFPSEHLGFAHLSFSVGSKEGVDRLTQNMSEDGITIVGEPRTTGDGYYESVVLDPEGNRVEITI